MKSKLLLPFIILSFGMFSCQEETPETPYGHYSIQTILSETAQDVNGDGEASNDMYEQLFSQGENDSKYYLSLISPEHYNTGFPQVIFNLPMHYELNSKVIFDLAYSGRRIEKKEDGLITLLWGVNVATFHTPNFLLENLEVLDFRFLQGSSKNLELTLNQRWYDHSQAAWNTTKTTYSLKKSRSE